ncbi:TniQ family protein [Desulfofalx alkaliphila]|uniref:TniQ family protein n=1 Tax=Desulfofalx alkaliphila TaxID=105483 RepID=UPI001EE4D44F|nr:TniQ family protein [Desulfofalx alkaliphila]
MLSFFPTPYEDELLYSVLARYHVRSGNTSSKTTMKELFGSSSITAVVELPANIDKLIERMPVNSKYTAEGLIFNHTMYPYYTAFLPPERAKKVLESMKNNNATGIYGLTGIMASSLPLNEYIRFCSNCLREDKIKYGELYWHRLHQLPCVNVCEKHQTPLQCVWQVENS